MENVKEKKEIAEKVPKATYFTLRLGYQLFERINHAVLLLKLNKVDNYNFSKQKWIHNLLKEKVEKEESFINTIKKSSQDVPKIDPKRIPVVIDRDLDERIEEILIHRRQDDPTFTKNTWILECIKE